TADIERHISVELAGVLNWSYLAIHEAGCRIDFAFDAGAVIGLDALEIELDELLGGDLLCPDRPVHVGNCRFLEVEARRGGDARGKRKKHSKCHRHTDRDNGDSRAKPMRVHGMPSRMIVGIVRHQFFQSIRVTCTSSTVRRSLTKPISTAFGRYFTA